MRTVAIFAFACALAAQPRPSGRISLSAPVAALQVTDEFIVPSPGVIADPSAQFDFFNLDDTMFTFLDAAGKRWIGQMDPVNFVLKSVSPMPAVPFSPLSFYWSQTKSSVFFLLSSTAIYQYDFTAPGYVLMVDLTSTFPNVTWLGTTSVAGDGRFFLTASPPSTPTNGPSYQQAMVYANVCVVTQQPASASMWVSRDGRFIAFLRPEHARLDLFITFSPSVSFFPNLPAPRFPR